MMTKFVKRLASAHKLETGCNLTADMVAELCKLPEVQRLIDEHRALAEKAANEKRYRRVNRPEGKKLVMTTALVREIKKRRENGMTYKQIAADLDITHHTAWRHATPINAKRAVEVERRRQDKIYADDELREKHRKRMREYAARKSANAD